MARSSARTKLDAVSGGGALTGVVFAATTDVVTVAPHPVAAPAIATPMRASPHTSVTIAHVAPRPASSSLTTRILPSVELCDHRLGIARLGDHLESVAHVEPFRGILAIDAQRHGPFAVSGRSC